MIYFTSDTHFGHKNVIEYCRRPFESVEEMDEELIRRWNVVVGPEDEVYHLGDFSFHRERRTFEILDQLNGKKFLIFGNHDKLKIDLFCENQFGWIEHYHELQVPDSEIDLGHKQEIILSHYPFESWNKRHYGSWHLHGHCHGTLPSGDHQARLDVGVDCWAFAPVSYEEIKKVMTRKVFKPVDHHGVLK